MGGHNSKAQIDQTALNKAIQTTIVKNTAKNTATANAVQTVDIKNTKFLNKLSYEDATQFASMLYSKTDITEESVSSLNYKTGSTIYARAKTKLIICCAIPTCYFFCSSPVINISSYNKY